MPVNSVPTKVDVEFGDPLTEKIRESIIGVEKLRAENRELTDKVTSLETTNLQLENEVRSLKRALDDERAERRHYHSLANEIITRLDVIGQTIDDVVKRAEHDVYRQRRENPRAELPEAELPTFLKKVEAQVNGQGEKSKAFRQ